MSGDSVAVSSRKTASTDTDPGTGEDAMDALVAALNRLLADLFALYIKTKNFHWHMSGRHFRDYHRLLDEQSSQIISTTDPLAERVRKLGAATLHSIGEVSRQQRIRDNDSSFVSADDMLIELLGDNQALASALRQAHQLCDRHDDIATASLIENWVDETEERAWFLREISGGASRSRS